MRERSVYHALNLVRSGDIHFHRHCLSSFLAVNQTRSLCCTFVVNVPHNDFRPFLGEENGCRPPLTLPATSNDRHLICELHSLSLLCETGFCLPLRLL